ncbi:MAG: NAD(P)-dependent oxidoreductase [Myxococcota bacterium]
MRVLIADKLASFVPGQLMDLGVESIVDPGLKDQSLTDAIRTGDPEVLVVRSTKVSSEALGAGRHLALVVRAGAGVNTIDVGAASGRGVYVANCPGRNAAAVAELTIGHLINLDRRIADNVQSLRDGAWKKKAYGGAPGLRGRTLAVLGCGLIGQEVIVRARALGMKIIGWSRTLTPERAEELGIRYAKTPEDAARKAHAVTVHLALATDTRGRIGDSVFSAMREGAYFINTSRGEVVDQDALLHAVRARGLRAGLDVFRDEPSADGSFEDPIRLEPNVYGTHHIGASTAEAVEAVGREVIRIISAYKEGEPIPNCVNLAKATEATHMVIVRHADEVGVLASVLDILSRAGHNVQEMQNIVFSGSEAACARIAVIGDLSSETLTGLQGTHSVYSVGVSPIAARS